MMRLLAFLLLSACSTDTFAIGDGGTTDAGGDRISNGDASCASFCAQPANAGDVICADWDESEPLKPWTTDISVGSGGTVQTSANEATSCMLSLQSSLPTVNTPGVTGLTTHALAVNDFAAGGSNRVVVAFDIFLPDGVNNNFSSYLALRADSVNVVDGVTIEQHGDALWFFVLHVGGSVPSNGDVSIMPLTNAWNHMTLDVTFATSGDGKASLSYIGKNGSAAPAAVIMNDTVSAASQLNKPSLYLGVSAPGTTTQTLTAYYDNVAVSLD